jgi:hypothetical protein
MMLASLAHQVAEKVTIALAEISLARMSAASEREFEDAVARAETALLQVRDPLQRLTTELATIADREVLSPPASYELNERPEHAY